MTSPVLPEGSEKCSLRAVRSRGMYSAGGRGCGPFTLRSQARDGDASSLGLGPPATRAWPSGWESAASRGGWGWARCSRVEGLLYSVLPVPYTHTDQKLCHLLGE